MPTHHIDIDGRAGVLTCRNCLGSRRLPDGMALRWLEAAMRRFAEEHKGCRPGRRSA